MQNTATIFRRELGAYFASPLAYVFIVIFLGLTGGLTFFVGGFLERGQANLEPFFQFHPWLYLLLVPALGMRLWAEERKTGTLEFLMTQPVSTAQVVVGKFLAVWAFAGIALALTFPIWMTVTYLGDPDNGVILAGYLGSWLMAGAFLAVSACASALTSNQVIAFVVAASLCFLFLMSGLELVLSFFRGWASPAAVQAVAGFSFLSNYGSFVKGAIDLPATFFFASLIVLGLVVNGAIVELKKGA